MNARKHIEVVAGLLFYSGRILACQRRADGRFPLKWEFPGGKIEPGEVPPRALVRELREELGIEARAVEEVFTHTHAYAGVTVHLRFFDVGRYTGEIVNRVFEQICWVSAAELTAMDFLDGDRPVVNWLISGNGGMLWDRVEF